MRIMEIRQDFIDFNAYLLVIEHIDYATWMYSGLHMDIHALDHFQPFHRQFCVVAPWCLLSNTLRCAQLDIHWTY